MSSIKLTKSTGVLSLGTVRVGPPGRLNVSQLKTSAYTVDSTDQLVRLDPTAGGFVVTLPLASSTKAGFVLHLKNDSDSTNAIAITPAMGDTVDAISTATMNLARQSLVLVSDGIDNWMVI